MATEIEHAMAMAFARQQVKSTGKAHVILDRNVRAKFPKGRHPLDVASVEEYQNWYKPENVIEIVTPKSKRAA